MKILILNWRDPKHPHAGGAEQATLEHAKAWVRAGHEVDWFSSKVKGLPEKEKIQGIRIIRRGYYVFGVQLKAFFHLLINKYDLVIDQIHGLPFFTPLYLRKTPKLAYIHEVAKDVVWKNPYPFPINKIVGTLASVFEPLVFKLVYKNTPFMTVSESTKKELQQWRVKNITVIHNGVTVPDNIQSFKKEEQKTLVYLGALAKDKGVEDAIHVFNKLIKKHPNWNYWIIGKSGDTYKNYLKQISDPKIKYWGFVDMNKKFELLSKAHVLVNPSIREGWGLVNLEANYVGTPVIGYKVVGMVDSVKNNDTGILVDKYDKNKLVQKIEEILESEHYREISKKCENWAKNFNWNGSTDKSLRLINNLCENYQNSSPNQRLKSL